MVSTYTIEINKDTTESNRFAKWANANGHTATVTEGCNSVGGVSTMHNVAATTLHCLMWDEYCNAI